MKHSHSDQFNRGQFYNAVNDGCNIIEIDLISIRGNLFLSHSWRPFGWLTYGKPHKYFMDAYFFRDRQIYLYIDIKTSDYRAIQQVLNLADKYKCNILIKGIDKWFSHRRKYIADEISKRNQAVIQFEEFAKDKDIERVDLYKGSYYKIWNRW